MEGQGRPVSHPGGRRGSERIGTGVPDPGDVGGRHGPVDRLQLQTGQTSSGAVKKLEILVDRTSIESFANEGEVSLSACFVPTDSGLAVECTRGSATIRSIEVFELESIWKNGP